MTDGTTTDLTDLTDLNAPMGAVCLDCRWHRKDGPLMSEVHHGYCVHTTPEYWEAQGWTPATGATRR